MFEMLTQKLRIHLANVWPNKSERVWTNARHAFATAVRVSTPTFTYDKDTPIAYSVHIYSLFVGNFL